MNHSAPARQGAVKESLHEGTQSGRTGLLIHRNLSKGLRGRGFGGGNQDFLLRLDDMEFAPPGQSLHDPIDTLLIPCRQQILERRRSGRCQEYKVSILEVMAHARRNCADGVEEDCER